MTLYVTKEALQKMVTLQKGYIDAQLVKKQDKFTVGDGLSLVDGVLSVTLDHQLAKVVTELPEAPAAADKNKIFLVPSTDSENGNTYVEYIYIEAESRWEKLGEFKTEVDLTPYLKVDDLTATATTTGFTLSKGTEEFLKVTFPTADFAGTSPNAKELSLALATVTSAKDLGFFKVKVDAKGRIIGTEAVAEADITALGFSTTTAMTQAINAAVQTEADAREAADDELDGKITDEATARATADGDLATALTAVTGRVKAIEDARAEEGVLSETETQELFESIYGDNQ